jgi:hypothetical protein
MSLKRPQPAVVVFSFVNKRFIWAFIPKNGCKTALAYRRVAVVFTFFIKRYIWTIFVVLSVICNIELYSSDAVEFNRFNTNLHI